MWFQLKRQRRTDTVIAELERAANLETPACEEYDFIYKPNTGSASPKWR
jgi:hypothetical protein